MTEQTVMRDDNVVCFVNFLTIKIVNGFCHVLLEKMVEALKLVNENTAASGSNSVNGSVNGENVSDNEEMSDDDEWQVRNKITGNKYLTFLMYNFYYNSNYKVTVVICVKKT